MRVAWAFWTWPWVRIIVASLMGRNLKIRVAFESSRLGLEHMRQAYELVVPTSRRRTWLPPSERVEVDAETQGQETRDTEEW